MKQGMSFEQVLERVDQEAASRQDYYVPTQEMHLVTEAGESRLATPCGQFAMRDTAHLHLAELCGIDRRYYQRMRTEAPFLLDRNVNHWLTTNPPKQRILRAFNTEDGNQARAIVSSRYAMLDNDALLRTVEPVLKDVGLQVESCDLSDEKLTIKMVSPRLRGDVAVGDSVQAGIIIRNSEVRCSAIEVDWFVKRLVCLNGMIVTGPQGRGAFRRHVGRDWDAAGRSARNGASGHGANGHSANGHGASGHGTPRSGGSLTYGVIPENVAREEWERAIWDQLQTSLRANLNTEAFTALLERLARTTRLETSLEADQIAERVANRFGLRPGEQSAMALHLVQEDHSLPNLHRLNLSLWNVLNAVTRTAEDVKEYERATELEELGGHLAHLSQREWERLVTLN